MSFSSRKELPFNSPPANELASQSTQQPRPVCTWSAHAPQSGLGPSPLSYPRYSSTLTATATAAGELFLFGGCASDDLFVLNADFSTTLLKIGGEVPTPRGGHDAVLIDTSTLLIFGGHEGVRPVPNRDSLYLLDLVSREGTRVVVNGPGPNGCYNHTTSVVGSKLFVFGGQRGFGGNNTSDMWTLDLNLNSQPLWSYEPTSGNEKPLPRSAHVSVTTEDRLIIFGGGIDQHLYNDTWSFDISTRKWTELQCTGSIPSPRSDHAAVLVDDVMSSVGSHGRNLSG
ncbi:hypothetical protein BGY98DRAFT_609643 [Russula aff. rugulosa BPL654]|nr:hypothetical protein BGY98DRAFT_609643 [Russula aff. rugulosa BPL654]